MTSFKAPALPKKKITMFSNWKIEVFLVTQSVSESIIRPQYLYQMQLKDVKIMLWSCFFVSNIVYCEKLWGKVSIEEINSFQPNLPPKSVQIYVINFGALDLFANWMKNKHICILYSLTIMFWSAEILYLRRKHDLALTWPIIGDEGDKILKRMKRRGDTN